MTYNDFINNAALLVLLSMLSGYFRYQWQKEHAIKDIALGLLYGLFTIIAMTTPLKLEGAIFDGRSIILAVAGLFEKPLVVLIAAGIGTVYRIYLGGIGTLTGVGSLVISGAIGLAFKYYIQKGRYRLTPLRLLLLGVITHCILLMWFITLPRDTFVLMMRTAALPYLLIFSLATMLIGIFMESQEQRLKTEKQLAESERRYRELVTNLHEGICLVDEDRKAAYVNPSMAKMLGYEREEMLGRSVFDFMDKKYHRDTEKCLARHQQGQREQYERELIHKNRSRLHTLVSVAPVYDDNGDYTGSLAGIQDITQRVTVERKLAEQSRHLEEIVAERTRQLESAQAQLIRSEKLAALGELAGSVGHELRNPLSVIANAVYLLKASLKNQDPKMHDYLCLIDEETRTASRIISELLDYSRIRIADTENVDAGKLVNDLLEEIELPANIQLEKRVSSRLPKVAVNPQQVKQILANLITNACQAMPKGGTLSISVGKRGNEVLVSVKDSGVGISEENLARLFEPLFTTKEKGLGFGLALSKKLAEINNISIEVVSEVGQGSDFLLKFPAVTG